MSETIAAAAKGAVGAQRRLDEAHAEAVDTFVALACNLPPDARDFVLPLGPPAQRITTFEQSLSLRVSKDRAVHLGLRSTVVGLACERAQVRSRGHQLHLRVHVTREPLPPPSDTLPGRDHDEDHR